VIEDMSTDVVVGNAGDDGAGQTRGWFVGHFIDASQTLRHTDAVEVKWGDHPAGESRSTTASGMDATTLSILIHGAFRVSFPAGDVQLARPGDYVLFGPGVPHSWTAETDSVVVTVRWPSTPGGSVNVAGRESS
jgi:hypothetical protein